MYITQPETFLLKNSVFFRNDMKTVMIYLAVKDITSGYKLIILLIVRNICTIHVPCTIMHTGCMYMYELIFPSLKVNTRLQDLHVDLALLPPIKVCVYFCVLSCVMFSSEGDQAQDEHLSTRSTRRPGPASVNKGVYTIVCYLV